MRAANRSASDSLEHKPAAIRQSILFIHKTSPEHGPAGRYLVNGEGTPVYLVDPGINGVYDKRPDGSTVQKFTAPKATLMSYIIKGILSGELPWGLVLLGVFISIVLELSGIPSLAFAVGVYLPISTSAPVWVGGVIRGLVDKYTRRKHAGTNLTEDQLVAEGDKSNGVLLSSGYIAGGTLAGVVFAFMNIPLKDKLDAIENGLRRTIHFLRAVRRPARAGSLHHPLRVALSCRSRFPVRVEEEFRLTNNQLTERGLR